MPVHTTPTDPSLVIRASRGSDGAELSRLAALDSAPALTGPALVAEMDGRIVAALATEDGARIADPFVATAGTLELLEMRRAQGRAERRAHGGRVRRLGLPHPRARTV